MKEVIVTLMSAPSVTVDGEKKIFPYRKVEGLFYYICIKKRITRDEAIGIFWVDCDEQSARKNLRDGLYHIKKIVGSDIIQLDGNVFISLSSEVDVQVDVDRLRDNILENYKGEFLSYFYVKNCLEFENWMEDYRRELRELYLHKVKEAAEKSMSDLNPEKTVHYTGKLIETFYQDERFYRKIIRFLLEEGEYSQAISLYQKFAAVLKQEFEEEPEAETRALMDQVLKMRRKINEKPDKEQRLFLGRERELYEIFDCIQNHQVKKEQYPCNFLLVSGEAGVGKTALMAQIRAMLEQDNYAVFSYSCCPAECSLYLKSWNDILVQIQEFCRRRKKELLEGRRNSAREITDYRLFMTQYGIHFEEILRSFCRDSGTDGTVLFLDDIQWMDPSSIQLLNNLLFRLRDCPLFVLAASRLEHVREIADLKISLMRESLIKEVFLKRFTLEEAANVIGAYAGEFLDGSDSVEKIYRYTDGNALFLTELLKTLKETNGTCMGENILTSRTVSIIESRLMNLSEEEHTLLRIMSIFQNEVTMEDIRIISREPELKLYDLLEKLLERQIIVERVGIAQIAYQFTHIIIRDYIQSKISAGRKQIYHREVARFYEEKYQESGNIGLMPMLVYHFENANDIYKKYAYRLEYIKAFFTGKQEIYPNISASFSDSLFPENLFLAEVDPGETVLIPLAKEIRALPEHDRNYQDLRMKVEYLVGRYDLSSGDYKKGLRNMSACIEAAKYMKDSGYLMDSYRQMIYYAIQVYDLDMMREYINACKDLLREYSYGDSEWYAVERLDALHRIKTGAFEEAREILDALIPKLEKLCPLDPACMSGLAACYNYRGEIYMKREQWDDALTDISRAVSCCKSDQPMAGLGMAYTNMGIILYHLDSYDKASDYFKKARGCFKDLSIQWGRTKEETYSALLELRLGKTKSALSHYQTACRYAGKDYSPNTTAMLRQVYEQLLAVPGMKTEIEAPPMAAEMR